jgi:hypothetical protein
LAQPRSFLASCTRGMRQDEPRAQMLRGAVWNLIDYIPDLLGAPAVERGGWAYASPDLSTVKATAGSVACVAHAPFTAGAQLVAVDEDGEVYTIASVGAATDRGAGVQMIAPAVFHRNLLIMPASNGTSRAKTWSGAALSQVGTGGIGKYAAVYKDRTLLGNTAAEPQRVLFSPAGAPASAWDTTNAFVNTSAPIRGLATLRNTILVFHDSFAERIRGAVAPPGGDMILENAFDEGCLDARSIATYGDFIVFANENGIFMTDGATVADLTEAGGMTRYWTTVMASWTSSWTISAGIFRGHYVISLMNGSTFVDCFVVDLDQRIFYRLSNMKAATFAPSVGVAGELYFGLGNTPRVCTLSSIFTPGSSYKNDGDGTAVTGVLETPFTKLGALVRLRHAYLGYDLRDAASDNPTMTLGYITSPEATSYTSLSPTLAETTAYSRKRIAISKRASGFAFKLSRSGASADARFYGLELDGHELEGSRRA